MAVRMACRGGSDRSPKRPALWGGLERASNRSQGSRPMVPRRLATAKDGAGRLADVEVGGLLMGAFAAADFAVAPPPVIGHPAPQDREQRGPLAARRVEPVAAAPCRLDRVLEHVLGHVPVGEPSRGTVLRTRAFPPVPRVDSRRSRPREEGGAGTVSCAVPPATRRTRPRATEAAGPPPGAKSPSPTARQGRRGPRRRHPPRAPGRD